MSKEYQIEYETLIEVLNEEQNILDYESALRGLRDIKPEEVKLAIVYGDLTTNNELEVNEFKIFTTDNYILTAHAELFGDALIVVHTETPDPESLERWPSH